MLLKRPLMLLTRVSRCLRLIGKTDVHFFMGHVKADLDVLLTSLKVLRTDLLRRAVSYGIAC